MTICAFNNYYTCMFVLMKIIWVPAHSTTSDICNEDTNCGPYGVGIDRTGCHSVIY